MPSKSKKQARTMTAACKSPEFRKKVDIPKKVACDFHKADKGKYHKEDTDMDDLKRIKKLAGINEKVELMANSEKDEKEASAEDVTKAMQMAKLKKKMEDRDSDDMDFHGLFTGVAKGEIKLDDKGKIEESGFGIIRALDEACGKKHNKKKKTYEEKEEANLDDLTDPIDDDNIDLDRVVADPYYRERVKKFLKAKHAEELSEEPLNEGWKCGQCGYDGMGFLDTRCSACGASDEYFVHDREEEWSEPDMDEANYNMGDYGRAVIFGKDDEEDEIIEPDIKRNKKKKDDDEYMGQHEAADEKKAGRRAAGSWGRVKTKSKKRDASKAVRRIGKSKAKYGQEEVDEAAPKGWEGTVKAMKKDKDIDNPWALAHWMKNKGYKSHKEESIQEKYEVVDTTKGNKVLRAFKSKDEATMWAGARDETGTYEVRPSNEKVKEERDMFSESEIFAKDSLARLMVEMIVDEMKNGKTAEEISEELCFNLENVRFVVEHFKKKVAEGYKVVPPIDREQHPERPGLEGPYRAPSGLIYYYDPEEGQYYDASSDMYLHPEYVVAHGIKEQGLPRGYDAWKTASPYDNDPSDEDVDRAFEDGFDYGMNYLHTDDMAKAMVADIHNPETDPDDRQGIMTDLISDVSGTVSKYIEEEYGFDLSEEQLDSLAREIIKKHFSKHVK